MFGRTNVSQELGVLCIAKSSVLERLRISSITSFVLLSGAEDEISFDPDDIITNVEMVSCFMSGDLFF